MEPRYKASPERVEFTVRDSREVVFDSDPTLQMIIDVRVTVPAGVNLELRSVAAGVVVEEFPGSLDLRGETGSCFVKSVGGDLSARATSGSITVGTVAGQTTLRTAAGGIVIGRLRGPAKIVTANGSVEVLQAYDSLHIRGDNADIIVGLSKPAPKSVDLATSAGSITLNIDRDLPITVDASTRLLGKVRTRGLEPVLRRGSFNQSSLLADFNGGGEVLRLRTSWGNIALIGRDPLGE